MSGASTFPCPSCDGKQCGVKDSRTVGGYRRRRRLCLKCKQRFTTHELVIADVEAAVRTNSLARQVLALPWSVQLAVLDLVAALTKEQQALRVTEVMPP